MEIKSINSKNAMGMVMDYHYSHRKVGCYMAFGLYESGLAGCVTYSIPASYTLCKGVCGVEFKAYVLELSRLVITTKTKNAASFLIGRSLKMIGDKIVVSYADCNEHVGHVGYVYQATNWIYTGHGNAEPLWCHPATGEVISYTRRHVDVKARKIGLGWKDLVKKPQVGKHRYVTFCGNRRFRMKAMKALRYEAFQYPKGNTTRHESVPSAYPLFD